MQLLQSQSMEHMLRDYQKDLVEEVREKASPGMPVIATAATGAGKSIMMLALISKAVAQGKKALIIAHRLGLLNQLAADCWNIAHLTCGYTYSGRAPQPGAPVQMCSIQSLKKLEKATWLQDIDIVIVDECHVVYTDRLIKFADDYLGHARIVGFTATPQRTGKKKLGDFYEKIITGPQTRMLIERGFLSDYRHMMAQATMQSVDVDSSTGDYDIQQLAGSARAIYGDAIKEWEKHASDRQTVAFCPGVEASIELAEKFGSKAAALHSKLSQTEQRQILKNFKLGNIQVITSCSMLIEGISVNDITCVLHMRPTTSLAIYLQSNGRGLRIGKNDTRELLVIDLTDNYSRFGSIDAWRDWELLKTVKKQKKKRKPKDEKADKRSLAVREIEAELVELDPGSWLVNALSASDCNYHRLLSQYSKRPEAILRGVELIGAYAHWSVQKARSLATAYGVD